MADPGRGTGKNTLILPLFGDGAPFPGAQGGGGGGGGTIFKFSRANKQKQKNCSLPLLCTSCIKWAHIVCEGIPKCNYDDMNESFENWQCTVCTLKQFPFWEHREIFPVETRIGCSHLLNITQDSTLNENNRYNILCDFPKEKDIKLAHLNIRSLRNKVTDVKKKIVSQTLSTFQDYPKHG